jgi:hypothetical protein
MEINSLALTKIEKKSYYNQLLSSNGWDRRARPSLSRESGAVNAAPVLSLVEGLDDALGAVGRGFQAMGEQLAGRVAGPGSHGKVAGKKRELGASFFSTQLAFLRV